MDVEQVMGERTVGQMEFQALHGDKSVCLDE